MTEQWASFTESWPLFADSVVAGTLAGAVLGWLGTYIVLRRMVFLSAALSQVAGLGVTLSFWASLALGLPAWLASPTLGAAVLALGMVGWLMMDRSADAGRRDAYLGVAFLVGAAGTLVVGTRIVQELQDVQSLLFGTAVAVAPDDLRELVVVMVGAVALHLWWRRGFTAIALDSVDAQVRGLPVRLLELALLASLALTISVTTRILGALPAFAFSVLPAMGALRVARNVHMALWIALGLGAVAGFWGYFSAFAWELPVGASQTLVGVALYVVLSGGGAISQRLAARRSRRSASSTPPSGA